MKHYAKLLAVTASAALLAGCGSSSSNTPTGYASFADIEVDAKAMQALYTDTDGNLRTGITPADEADIPDTGGQTYNGFVGGEVAGSELIGELTLNADFLANTVSSSATNFYHETDGAYTGTLTGTGVLDQSPPMGVSQVSTGLDGTLSNGGTDYTTSIALEGDIIANGTDPIGAVAGFADGSLVSSAGTEFFTGVFVAEQ